MRRFATIVGVGALAALALAVPAQADDQSFLDAAGPMPGPIALTGIIQMGHAICDQLRIDPSTDNLGPRVVGRASWVYNYITPQVVDAAQQHLCPDTLGATPPAPAP